MSQTLEFKYAKIKIKTRECLDVFTSSYELTSDIFYEYVELDELNTNYKHKYYINSEWYEDANGTIPWSPT